MSSLTKERILNCVQALVDGGEALLLGFTPPMHGGNRIVGATFSASAARSLGVYEKVDPSAFDDVELNYLLIRINRGCDGAAEWVTPLGVFTSVIYAYQLVHRLGFDGPLAQIPDDCEIIDLREIAG